MPVVTLILAVLVAAPDERKAVADFKRAFARGLPTRESVDRKDAALAALAPFDSERVAKALVSGFGTLEREAEALEEKRRPLLEQGGGRKLLPFRLELRPVRRLQAGIVTRLRALRDVAATRYQVRLLLKKRSGLPFTLRVALVGAAARLADRDLLLDATGKRLPAHQLALLLDSVSGLGREGAAVVPWVVEMLAHADALVRVRAAAACSRLRAGATIPHLVRRLETETGRVKAHVARALEELTGQKLGTSAKAWRRWLAAEGGPFVRGEKPLGGHTSTVTAEATGGYYFGIPQDGRSILYVYDNSLSMRQPLDRKAARDRGKDASPRRVDRARKELIAALRALRPDQSFNIIAFANRIDRFDRKMQRATKDNVRRATEWLDEMKLRFGTNTYDALELAFNTAGRGAFDRFYPLAADTVFLLSDGLPMIQKMQGAGITPDRTDAIIDAVRRWNPFRRIVVHTIGLGIERARPRRFLRTLAEENGRRFVAPK